MGNNPYSQKNKDFKYCLSLIYELIEEEFHKKIPVPKKVKPGYKKKRKEEIERKIRRAKKDRIREIYRRRAKEEAKKNEDR